MKIDFYLYEPRDVAVWESLYKALRRRGADAQWVLEPPGRHTGQFRGQAVGRSTLAGPAMTASCHEDTAELLAARGYHHLSKGRYLTADAVVTRHEMRALLRYRCLRIRTALGTSVWSHATLFTADDRGFDAILVTGRVSRVLAEQAAPTSQVIEVGCPEMLQARQLDDRERLRNRFGLNPRRRTIAYFPTWGPASSLERFGAVVEQHAPEHNVLVLPHPHTLRAEPGRLGRSRHVVVVTDELSRVPLLLAADLVLTDLASPALGEACLLDRPNLALVGTEPPRSHSLLEGVSCAVPILSEPDELPPIVEFLLQQDPFAEGRSWLASQLYAWQAGQDDVVAARAIEDVITSRQLRPSSPSRRQERSPAERQSIPRRPVEHALS